MTPVRDQTLHSISDSKLGQLFSEWVRILEPLTHNERVRIVSAVVVFYDLPVRSES